jgi:hypothetical protein
LHPDLCAAKAASSCWTITPHNKSWSIATYELLRRVGYACALPVCPPHVGGGLGSNQKHLYRMLFRVRPCCESTSRMEPAAGSAPTPLRYERSVLLATLHRHMLYLTTVPQFCSSVVLKLVAAEGLAPSTLWL